MLKVEAVKEGSPAERAGLKRDDVLVSIDGDPVRDVIDFLYNAGSKRMRVQARRDSKVLNLNLSRDERGIFGLRFEPLRPRTCANNCVFCFVDQLPGGLRPTLYVKDEDYRFSFLYGNFITMTGLGESSLRRIVSQRLSPLYVSVHSTDPSLRTRMLGVRKGADVLPKLRKLRDGGVHVHAQVVLCPGLNDEAELQKTVLDLAKLFPGVQSMAIVPVGLTRFRQGLPRLRSVDEACSTRVLESVDRWQRSFLERTGSRFVFAADEFYLLSGCAVPQENEYEGYPQLENGVGLVRLFLQKAASLTKRLKRRTAGRPFAVLTGELAEPVWKEVLNGGEARAVKVKNRFLGESVTVCGLLAGRDLLAAAKALRADEVAVVSESCLNVDRLFLDGMSLQELERLSVREVIVEGLGDEEPGRYHSGPAQRREVHAFQ
ncbi:MAG: DUF512 domain-containing protein [Candidatus Eiseniibacteriota bacterium]|nr:MAG: DUF512 domain-containing protein [Candidatus Eisenbacteria bacterium]